jgi:hypothetical protein
MELDVRIPLGWLFTILGAILVVYGLISDPAIYARSLGENVNLHWGLVFAIFGGAVLIFSRKKT